MALEMALVRATDSLDIYIRFARRKPSIISDIELQKEIDGSNRSIFRKFNAIRRRFLDADDEVKAIAALIEVMIVWRNRMVHSDEDNEVEPKSWETLRKSASWIKNEFRGMEVDRLFSDFKSETPPKFKEIASFIRATHEAVRITDASLLKSLDPESFLKRLISVKAGRAIPSLDESASRAKQVQSIWGRDESSRPQKILSFLKNCGLSEAATAGGSFAATFPDNLIAALASKTPKEASEWLDVPMMPEEK